jgi:hypothetical protein
MSNIKVNGNTYNNIARIRVTTTDGGNADYVDATFYDGMMSKKPFDLYDPVTEHIEWFKYNGAEFTVNFPNVISVGRECFMSSSITEARLPNLKAISAVMFGSASKIRKCIFGEFITTIPAQAFYGAANNLTTLVLPYDGVVTLNANAFQNSTFSGYVYVPATQVDNYKADANWSTYADQIRAIEDYPDEVV